MPHSNLERLQEIKTLSQLTAYLRDELDWPIEAGDAEDITFDYTPSELGLDQKAAVRVKEIKQLRPLTGNQPWGIFFVNFEKKRLPVVVMRLILRALVLKKRSSANKAERQAWQPSDLLFISAYGEETERAITFAHFVENPGTNLAELRVLGWDDDDTPLHIEYVANMLSKKLRWDDKLTTNPEGWRRQWSDAFLIRHRHVIRTSEELADALAVLAKTLRNRIQTILRLEDGMGEIRKLQRAFQQALIHDLDDEGFADMFAQTVTYGLFSVSVRRTFPGEGTAVTKDDVPNLIFTSPFLKEMLGIFLGIKSRKGKIDFDQLGVSDVSDLLTSPDTHMEVILADFNNKTRGEDPVIHFYEHFLNAYNKKLKIQRGVFYTPQPVVSYIVRSVHERLQIEFGLADGLADTTTWGEMVKNNPGLKLPPLTDEPGDERTIEPDEPFVQILDPATGTATFLVEVIDVIYRTLTTSWEMQRFSQAQQDVAWNDYVPKHLLPRLHAFELMMAPYAIAHMKIGLKLAETGYRFGTEQRARIYLTNALEKADDRQTKLIGFDALAHEAEAVNKIKKTKRFTVIIGNPPYANYSANLSPQARRIVDKYRNFRGVPIRERNQLQFERNIQDDFVKFISIAQDIVNKTGVGVLSYITNGTMLASASLRGMRENLAREFNRVFELNLHGGGNEIIAGAEDDENVFDIVQSVAIHVYVRSKHGGTSEVNYADLLGPRSLKYSALDSQSVTDTEWRRITPDVENCGFTPQDDTGGGANRRLDSAFVKFGAGIKTNRDAVVIGFDDATLLESVRQFDGKLASLKNAKDNIHSLLYRPFDVRRIFYHEDVVASRSLPTMKHVIAGPNIGLVCSSTWTTPDRFSVDVSRLMVEMKTGTHDRGTTFFPLYRYETLMAGKAEKVHNLTSEFVKEWCATTSTQFTPTGHGDGYTTTGPEDVLFWLYGLFYSPAYRRRYRAALSQRFPILFLTSNLDLFRSLARLGGELTSLHLMESSELDKPITDFIGGRLPLVEKISWSKKTVWIDKAQSIGFKGVCEDVWNFHMGGYPVCEKWLKDRKGHTLAKDDITHYQKVVVAVSETIRLMGKIDEVIDEHGGWPLK